MQRPIVLVWDNFGYMHDDRCVALAKHYAGKRHVIGVEIAGSSDTYNWNRDPGIGFEKVTLYEQKRVDGISIVMRAYSMLLACLRPGKSDVFLCHYENLATFAVAIGLRLLGSNVYVMNNSKFDDKKRRLRREALKAIFFKPYQGALVAGARSAAYLKFLGMSSNNLAIGYNALSIARVRASAESSARSRGRAVRGSSLLDCCALCSEKKPAPRAGGLQCLLWTSGLAERLTHCGIWPTGARAATMCCSAAT